MKLRLTFILGFALTIGGCAVYTPPMVHTWFVEGDIVALREYLADGGDPNTVMTAFGNTLPLLHHAALYGSVEGARELIGAGANVNQGWRMANVAAPITPMGLAMTRPAMLRLFVDAGADTRGAISSAASMRCVECVEILLEAGSNINERSEIGYTPLMSAVGALGAFASTGTPVNATELIEFLVRKGADIENAMSAAAAGGCTMCIEPLLKAGADINEMSDLNGYSKMTLSPLMHAADNGKWEMMEALRAAGADESRRDIVGRTAAVIATEKHRAMQIVEQQKIEQQRRAAIQQQQAAAAQRQQQESGGFQWGKMLAMGVGVAAGGLDELDSATQIDIVSSIVQDSMAGNEGMSNLQATANNYSRQPASSAKPLAGGGGVSYPARPNTLDGHPACSGYTVDNYKQYFQANSSGPDVQMYLNAIRQGYSQADSDRTYSAFQDAARTATGFYESAR